MKKSNRKELSFEQTEKLVTLALEERNPFEIIKKEFGLAEKEVLEIMKKKMPLEKFEMWKKKATANKSGVTTKASLALWNLFGVTCKAPKSDSYTSTAATNLLFSAGSNLVDPPVKPESFCLLTEPTITIEGSPPLSHTDLITVFS